ncbi:hypothetical protein Q9966_015530 [Columba livia]|nr:hypothetical protein Q9966_015530 [Columba livia]
MSPPSVSSCPAPEPQLPQPFLTREMLHSLQHLGGCAGLSAAVPCPAGTEGPQLDTIFQVWSPQGRAEGQENLSDPLTTPF